MDQEAKRIKDIVCKVLDEHKAVDITILNVEEMTVLTDYFVICTAKSSRQVKALTEFVEEALEKEGITPLHRDGAGEGNWSVLDMGGVILHIFNDETRMFYCLEKLWSDGKNIEKYPSEK